MPERVCACGCGTSLTGRRANVLYHSPAHKTAAWKARAGYADQRARKPSPRRTTASRSGRQLPYRKTVDTLTDWIALNWPRATDPHAIAEHVLNQALPDKQRANHSDHERSVA